MKFGAIGTLFFLPYRYGDGDGDDDGSVDGSYAYWPDLIGTDRFFDQEGTEYDHTHTIYIKE